MIPILILGLIFSGIRQIFILPLTKLKKTSIISILSVGIAAINILLNLLFIPQYGKQAACYSGVAAQLIGCMAFYWVLRHFHENDYNMGIVVKCVGLFAICSAGVLLVPDFGWMLNSVIGISSLLLFIGGLFLLKVVGWTEVEELMKIVGNKIPFLK